MEHHVWISVLKKENYEVYLESVHKLFKVINNLIYKKQVIQF